MTTGGRRGVPVEKADVSNTEDAPHPGAVLRREFLDPLGIKPCALAKALHVPNNRVIEIVEGRRGVTADTALRLARYFGGPPEMWLALQAQYDLQTMRAHLALRIEREITPRPPRRRP